jgi:hypothetical protein
MLEKVCAAITIIVTFVALWAIKMMDLPMFIAIPVVFVAVIACLVGIVFLFAEGRILTSARRAKAVPDAEDSLDEAA